VIGHYGAPPALRPSPELRVPQGDPGFVIRSRPRTTTDDVAQFADLFRFWDYGRLAGDYRIFGAAFVVAGAALVFGLGAATSAATSKRARR